MNMKNMLIIIYSNLIDMMRINSMNKNIKICLLKLKDKLTQKLKDVEKLNVVNKIMILLEDLIYFIEIKKVKIMMMIYHKCKEEKINFKNTFIKMKEKMKMVDFNLKMFVENYKN